MKITITKVPTGIHSQLRMDVENLHRADEQDLKALSNISKAVKEYNEDQNENA